MARRKSKKATTKSNRRRTRKKKSLPAASNSDKRSNSQVGDGETNSRDDSPSQPAKKRKKSVVAKPAKSTVVETQQSPPSDPSPRAPAGGGGGSPHLPSYDTEDDRYYFRGRMIDARERLRFGVIPQEDVDEFLLGTMKLARQTQKAGDSRALMRCANILRDLWGGEQGEAKLNLEAERIRQPQQPQQHLHANLPPGGGSAPDSPSPVSAAQVLEEMRQDDEYLDYIRAKQLARDSNASLVRGSGESRPVENGSPSSGNRPSDNGGHQGNGSSNGNGNGKH